MPGDEPKPKSPYREPAPVLALIPGPKPLWPFKAWNNEQRLITVMAPAGEPAEISGRKSNVFCPKCAINMLKATPKLCEGRVVGMCKKVVCAERRPHFHVRCSNCGWAVLMGTYEESEKSDA